MAPLNGAADNAPPGRLVWRCRRGMKELDLLLLRYLHGAWASADAAQRACFEQFLDLPDPQIVAYLVAGEPAADPQLARLIDSLRAAP